MDVQALQKDLKERYLYREDGKFCWRYTTVRHKAGQVAGWLKTDQAYRAVRALEGHLTEHRAIFAYHFGQLPEVVDHINGDSLDNRIENLRASTPSENAKNKKKPSNNTSGYKGVDYQEKAGKWRARIRVDRKSYSLGHFEKIEDAVKARQDAEMHYYGELRRR